MSPSTARVVGPLTILLGLYLVRRSIRGGDVLELAFLGLALLGAVAGTIWAYTLAPAANSVSLIVIGLDVPVAIVWEVRRIRRKRSDVQR